jgi:hypothetical protein
MDTDRNLLFGVLALQVDLIDNEQFVEACTSWTARKDQPLAEILVARGWMTRADQEDVKRLLERKPKKHRGDVTASQMQATQPSAPGQRSPLPSPITLCGGVVVALGSHRPAQ